MADRRGALARPRVVDEIRHGLWFFETSLLDAAPSSVADLRSALPAAQAAAARSAAGSAATRTATRAAGPRTIEEAVARARALALTRYRAEVRELAASLGVADTLVEVSRRAAQVDRATTSARCRRTQRGSGGRTRTSRTAASCPSSGTGSANDGLTRRPRAARRPRPDRPQPAREPRHAARRRPARGAAPPRRALRLPPGEARRPPARARAARPTSATRKTFAAAASASSATARRRSTRSSSRERPPPRTSAPRSRSTRRGRRLGRAAVRDDRRPRGRAARSSRSCSPTGVRPPVESAAAGSR